LGGGRGQERGIHATEADESSVESGAELLRMQSLALVNMHMSLV
jgi:hypothetical protein